MPGCRRSRTYTMTRGAPSSPAVPDFRRKKFRWHQARYTRTAADSPAPDAQAALYSIFWYGMFPDVISRKGLPFFTPTVPNPVAVDKKERKSPGMAGFK